MEWVVATAATLDEAKQQALEELGIDEGEAEFEILEEPRSGLFGRVRGEARVRARVVPRTPPAKVERRDRRSGSSGPKRGRAPKSSKPGPKKTTPEKADKPDKSDEAGKPDESKKSERATSRAQKPPPTPKEPAVSDITLPQQAEATADFLRGFLDAFDLDGDIEINEIDEDNTEVAVQGDDLGLLIGPRGQTLQAVGELSRAASAQTLSGRAPGRIHLDIGMYRQKRRDALSAFTQKIASEVVEMGTAKALEPMAAADRKVVHDTCNELDGVTTLSEGQDPNRRVVIEPA